MDINDFTPANSGSLSAPAAPRPIQSVATFSPPRQLQLDEIWHGQRATALTSDGSQGDPYGSARPGHGLEHEPVDTAERESQDTAQGFDLHGAAGSIRAALRPGTPATGV